MNNQQLQAILIASEEDNQMIKSNKTENIDSSSQWRIALTWIFQIILWLLIVVIILSMILDIWKIGRIFAIAFIIPVYIAYFVFQLYSNTFAYLNSLNSSISIKEYINNLRVNPFKLIFKCQCYHIVKQTIRNNNSTRTVDRTIITHYGSEVFDYNYWKDISEEFIIEKNKMNKYDFNNNSYSHVGSSKENYVKPYIKLHLDKQFVFNDIYTDVEYKKKFYKFYCENLSKDRYINIHLDIELKDFHEFNIIKIGNSSFLFGKWWFLFFTFIFPIAQLYKYYFNYLCSTQYFTVKKQISTRYDINNKDQKIEDTSDLKISKKNSTDDTVNKDDKIIPNNMISFLQKYNDISGLEFVPEKDYSSGEYLKLRDNKKRNSSSMINCNENDLNENLI